MTTSTDGPNGLKAFWWVMGVIGTLLVAGVIGSVATYASVAALRTNVDLLRGQMMRDMDRQEVRIRSMENKFDAHINDERGGV